MVLNVYQALYSHIYIQINAHTHTTQKYTPYEIETIPFILQFTHVETGRLDTSAQIIQPVWCMSKAPLREEQSPAVFLATYYIEKYVLLLQLPNDFTVHKNMQAIVSLGRASSRAYTAWDDARGSVFHFFISFCLKILTCSFHI